MRMGGGVGGRVRNGGGGCNGSEGMGEEERDSRRRIWDQEGKEEEENWGKRNGKEEE